MIGGRGEHIAGCCELLILSRTRYMRLEHVIHGFFEVREFGMRVDVWKGREVTGKRSLRSPFLGTLHQRHIPISVCLIGNVGLRKRVRSFSRFIVLLGGAIDRVICGRTVSAIIPSHPISRRDGGTNNNADDGCRRNDDTRGASTRRSDRRARWNFKLFFLRKRPTVLHSPLVCLRNCALI